MRLLNSRRILLFYIFLFTSVTAVFSLGGKEKNRKEPLEVIQVTGTVKLTGTANFPEIIIANSEGSWVIAKEEMDKLYDLQHRTVTVEGEETVTELRFANGLPAGLHRELRNIKIIAVQQ
jgi:hypothetical protein